MELPAARVSDEHVCPQLAHKGGPVITGSPNIHIEGRPAARATDPTTCLVGGPDRIAEGCGTVHLNGELFFAARLSDRTEHDGVLTSGAAHVYIGLMGDAVAVLPIGAGSGSAVPDQGDDGSENQPPQSNAPASENDSSGVAAATQSDMPKFLITVADRAVKGTLGAFYHYSTQCWRCDRSVPLRAEMRVADFKKDYPDARLLESIELLVNSGWEVWVFGKENLWSLATSWYVSEVAISVVHFSDNAVHLGILAQGAATTIAPQWVRVTGAAAGYGYAEQGGPNFSGRFFRWPDSKYQMPGSWPFNNSNTFVRSIVAAGGLTMMELGFPHPGADSPSAIPDIYSDTPWREGSTRPPAPAGGR